MKQFLLALLLVIGIIFSIFVIVNAWPDTTSSMQEAAKQLVISQEQAVTGKKPPSVTVIPQYQYPTTAAYSVVADDKVYFVKCFWGLLTGSNCEISGLTRK